ncbi:MAG TPA: NDP-sugar synthase [Vicinamibacterales bacterium]|nr:NDP-sugar synthase [Vicinamibacterales bacterium]
MRRPPALVLTAGLGTRLRPLTYLRAKAAVPVNGQPLAVRVSAWLAAHGFVRQVLNLHHHPATITAVLGDGSGVGAEVRYSWEQPVLGSAGGPRHALPLLTDAGDERFLIVNGDTLTDADLDALLAAHARARALVTMALVPNPAPHKYGGVAVSGDGYVTGFTRRGAALDSYHFIGLQVVESRAFAPLADGVPAESVGALYPSLIAQDPRSVAAFISDAAFHDIGTPGDCLRTSLHYASVEGSRLVAPSARIAPDATVERTAVWDDVTIGAGARLVECIVGDGVHIPGGASFERAAIVPAGARTPAGDERIERDLLVRPLDAGSR